MKHILLILLILLTASCSENRVSRTEVSIVGEEFYINGKPTFEGKTWRGMKIQGLLPNARLVNGIFDDKTDSTVINGCIRIQKCGMPTAIQESL